MTVTWRRRTIVFLCALVWALTATVIALRYRATAADVLEIRTEIQEREIASVLDGYRRLASFTATRIMRSLDVARLTRQAFVAGPGEERARIRAEVMARLQSPYDDLQRLHIRQLHIHFPDSVSFLRVHAPDRFGDSVAGVRHTVDACNRDRAFVEGYEEGRVFNGYRFVFPLADGELHAGSMEISISFRAVTEGLSSLFGGRYQFLVAGPTAREIVFPDFQSVYRPSALGEAFVLDMDATEADLLAELRLSAGQVDGLIRDLDGSRTVSRFVRREGVWHLLMFKPFREYSARSTGFLVSRVEVPELRRAWRDAWLLLGALSGLYAVIGLLLTRFVAERRRRMEAERYLPICASCRRVRSADADAWEPASWMTLEEHFHREKDARFSHGLCPSCSQELYGELGGPPAEER